ncbi:MAG: DUF349 domain-containing protein [Paludibacter sp.]|jgi:hypothetical protein|nr:DUF349 domain-containing protein [Paludibacter sp.]
MDPLELNKDAEIVDNDLTQQPDQTNSQVTEELPAKEPAKTVQPEDEAETAVTPEVAATEAVEPKEEAVAEVVSEEKEKQVVPESKSIDLQALSREELVAHLKQLLTQEIEAIKDEVEHVKLLFYKKLKADNEENKKVFLESGGEEHDYKPVKDGLDEELKTLLNEYKTKKAALIAKTEADKENNLIQKQHILERMKVLVESNDDVSSHINEFRELQKKWKIIGQVPQEHVNELWKSYAACQESFWDLIKINNELREYDFKKNLELKTAICEAAERLDEESDVISAFHQLQKLHDEWRETGPVAREFREDIWNRFKAASAVINRKHQGHFDEIRKIEEDNLVAKTALCEKIEAYDFASLNSYKAWDEATKTIMGWQEEWRTIGFAPRKSNHKIFDRYRAACDAFFNAKAEFYKASKNVLSENLEKKKALCEQAEMLKDSTDWKETAETLIRLQKEWKTIGPVAKKYSDEVWKRFISACDYFFEQKQKNSSGQRTEELENLTKKKELIAKINELDTAEDKTPAEVLTTLREYIAMWNEIGHVPFRDKDKIYKEYRSAVDKMFEKLNVDANQRRLDTFKTNLKDMSTKGENKLLREREKLMRAYEHLKSEIATYENNIGFLTSTNKKGSGLIKEMERKIEALKEEAALIEQKITLIEESL